MDSLQHHSPQLRLPFDDFVLLHVSGTGRAFSLWTEFVDRIYWAHDWRYPLLVVALPGDEAALHAAFIALMKKYVVRARLLPDQEAIDQLALLARFVIAVPSE